MGYDQPRRDEVTDLAIDALAVFRLWRLLAKDEVLDVPRAAWQNRMLRGHHLKAIVFLGCPWCLGFWLCLGALAVKRYVPGAWSVVRAALATSALVGLIAQAEPHA